MNSSVTGEQITNVHTRIYVDACKQLQIPYELALNTHALYITTKTGKRVLLYKSCTPLNTIPNGHLSKNKRDTTITLAKSGIPVPIQERIKDLDALERFHRVHNSIVVKPVDGMGGKGITVLPKQSELKDAFEHARKVSKKIIVETYIAGENYRFLVLDDNVLAVSLRIPPHVIGDGSTSVETLLQDYNLENKAQGLAHVPINSYTWNVIKNQGYKRHDILERGKKLYVRLTANLSLGGTVKDVSEICDISYQTIAINAAKAVGLRLAGIDIIAPFINKPGAQLSVIETNANPGMRIHYKDENGSKRNVALAIIKSVYEL